ncbi:MAG TPA: hypothetical protein VHJ19_03210 [Gammaproteobacteria bacterium]|nr:hypothetical protein [Gammaproteobacteria bacterium]
MGQTGMTWIFDRTLIVGLALVVVLLFLSIGVAYRNIQYLHDHSRGVARAREQGRKQRSAGVDAK